MKFGYSAIFMFITVFKNIFPFSGAKKNLKELLFGNKLTDVTLVSDDKIAFKAHKFLLGACSPVLRDLLIESFHPQPIIYLGGIHSYELEAILSFLYLGKTRLYP